MTESLLDDLELPVHPTTGVRAIAVLPSGRPVWPIKGGSDDDGGNDPDDDQDDTDPDNDDDQDDDDKPFDADRARRAISKRNSENRSLRARLKQLEPLAKKAKEDEDAKKSETERLTERASQAEDRAAQAELKMLRREIADEKGLTSAQARFLTGTTDEEIEKSADDLLKAFAKSKDDQDDGDDDRTRRRTRIGGRPRTKLRSGGAPDDEPEETDPRKLADRIGRL